MPSLATPSMVTLAAAGVRDVDDFGIDARAHGFEHGLAGAFGREVDGAGAVEVERDAGFVRGDEGEDDLVHVAAGEVVRLERIGRHIEAGFHRGDAAIDDEAHRHAAQAHGDHFYEADRGVRDPGAEPNIKIFAKQRQSRTRRPRAPRRRQNKALPYGPGSYRKRAERAKL